MTTILLPYLISFLFGGVITWIFFPRPIVRKTNLRVIDGGMKYESWITGLSVKRSKSKLI